MTTVFERFLASIHHQETHPVPVVGWDNAVPITRLAGILAKDYYRDAAVKMAIQKKVLDEFPEIRWVPGFHADYGVVIEASSFGCPVQWMEDDSPYAHPVLTSLADIDKLAIPDPARDGLMPEALGQYRYFWDHIDRRYVDEYGYLDGFALSMGPLEIVSSLRGHEGLFLDMYDDPVRLERLLEMVTEYILRWLRAQEKFNGPCKFLILVDHMPGSISLDSFERYAFPYFKHIFGQFPNAVHLYHNEGASMHYLSRIPDFGAHVFHCGKVNLAKAKKLIGDRVCLMGNLHAPTDLLTSKPERVTELCLEMLRIAAPNGGYLLCTGGAMAPGTPRDSLRAMISAAESYESERNH